MYLSPRKKLFVDTASEMFGEGAIITKQNTRDAADKAGVPFPGWFRRSCNVAYNAYKLPSEGGEAAAPIAAAAVETGEAVSTVNLVATNMEKQDLVPALFEGFVAWGNFGTIEKIVKSGMFYPIFVTGLSGNGKTLMVEQVHAKLNKELIRVNITIETDEDDLLGGFRLVNGETKFVPGPVIEAMERGCTLLLDECDLGSNKLLALQPVLEGKGVFLKKINKWVKAKDGFNVMATANTKGKGSEDGRFIGTNILNEAFLERFAITLEQPYATATTEKKIVMGSMEKYKKVDEEFATNLITWADVIRKTFYDGGVDEVISTRRLDHIVKAFAIFGDKMKAIELCVARFDEDTKASFMDLYTKIDAGINVTEEETISEVEDDTEAA
ncbi:MAG: MoxR family ATPase, partial [Candidatus Poribacteria bacterium]|nr:MoxR family ATPase [Candidatus Poribacteria bacterium]